MNARELTQALGISRQRFYLLLQRGRIEGAVRKENGKWNLNSAVPKVLPPEPRSKRAIQTVLIYPPFAGRKLRKTLGIAPEKTLVLANGLSLDEVTNAVLKPRYKESYQIRFESFAWKHKDWTVASYC